MSLTRLQNPQLDSSPFFYPGSPTGVLLLHGLTATPVEVKLVGEYLHEHGYTVSGPRLPGHASSVEELNRCSWCDWVEHAREAYLDLDSRCQRVFVGGESMGGLLALFLASEYLSIAGLLIYAPVLRASSRLILLTPLLKHVIKTLEKNRPKDDPDSLVNQRWQGYTVDAIPALSELLTLQRQLRRRLHRVTQPLLVLQGRQDTTVDTRGAREIIDQVRSDDKELVWFERSSHCVMLDSEWEEAAQKTLAFLRRIEGQ
jgi:carboxylesterase